MGSFANSLQIKSESPEEVVRTIESLMRGDGCAPTENGPDPHLLMDFSSGIRGQKIANVQNGWVGVLDSDMLGGSVLAGRISEHLGTAAFWFYVNDSDSWGYHLFTGGLTIDEFDSLGGQEVGEDMGDYIPGAPDLENDPAILATQLEIDERFDEIQEKMKAEMPDDIRRIRERMDRREANSAEDLRKFGEWSSIHGQRYGEMMVKSVTDLVPNFEMTEEEAGIPARSDAELKSHLEKLRPILVPSISEDDVLGILRKRATFAEETLGEFMELVGIPARFANLSYQYFEEFTKSDLNAAGIEQIAHLKFEDGSLAV